MKNETHAPIFIALKSKIRRYPVLSAFVALWFLFAVYLVLIASPKFESESLLVLKSSDPAPGLSSASLLMGGFNSGSITNDTEIAKAFIGSPDLLLSLNEKLGLKNLFQSSDIDFAQRLDSEPTTESLVGYFQDHVTITVDSASSLMTLKTRAYEPDLALAMNEAIIADTELFINQIGNELAEARLEFAKKEHQNVESQFETAKAALLDFQEQNNVFDPKYREFRFSANYLFNGVDPCTKEN